MTCLTQPDPSPPQVGHVMTDLTNGMLDPAQPLPSSGRSCDCVSVRCSQENIKPSDSREAVDKGSGGWV
ncbi:unnamed protein product [Arctogadus glacialis]